MVDLHFHIGLHISDTIICPNLTLLLSDLLVWKISGPDFGLSRSLNEKCNNTLGSSYMNSC